MPVTLRAFIGMEADKWPTFFAPEKAYLTALLESLASPAAVHVLTGVTLVEAEAGCRDVKESDPHRLHDATQLLLRRHGLLPAGGTRSISVFQALQPGIDRALYPADAPPPRGRHPPTAGASPSSGTSCGHAFEASGCAFHCASSATASEPFLRASSPAARRAASSRRSGSIRRRRGSSRPETLHALCEQPTAPVTGLSHARLRTYREALARSLYKKVLEGVSGPQETGRLRARAGPGAAGEAHFSAPTR